MRWRILAGMLLLAGGLMASAGWAADTAQLFDSTGLQKANGLRVQLRYPAGFTAGDPPDASMLQQFVRVSMPVMEMLLLQITPIDKEDARKLFPAAGGDAKGRLANWKALMNPEDESEDGDLVIRETKIGERAAVIVDTTMTDKEGEEPLMQMLRMMFIQDGDKVVQLSCALGGPVTDRALLETKRPAFEQDVCQPYFDSLKFL